MARTFSSRGRGERVDAGTVCKRLGHRIVFCDRAQTDFRLIDVHSTAAMAIRGRLYGVCHGRLS